MATESKAKSEITTENEEIPNFSSNPVISKDEFSEEELKKLRGDAIGETMYTERFILNTLMQLQKLDNQKLLEVDEDFEASLCRFWDMTTQRDIVKYLLEQEVFELFIHCINTSTDIRLIEIMVGIIGNMCILEEGCKQLCNREMIVSLATLINCGDSPTIILLMRQISAYLFYANDALKKQWLELVDLPHFLKYYCDIISNSMSKPLLIQAITTLNDIVICYDDIENQNGDNDDMFGKEYIIKSLSEAFETFLDLAKKDSAEDNLLYGSKKVICSFLEILSVSLRSKYLLDPNYDFLKREILAHINSILGFVNDKDFLMPIKNSSQTILSHINNVFYLLNYMYDENCLRQILNIWFLTESAEAKLTSEALDFEDDHSPDDYTDHNLFGELLWNMIVNIISHANNDELKYLLDNMQQKLYRKILDRFQFSRSDGEEKVCFEKLIKIRKISDK